MHILNDINLLHHPDFSYIHDLPLKKLNIKYKNYYLIKIFNKILKSQKVNITENKIKQDVLNYCKIMNYNSKNEFLLLFKSNFKNPQFKYNIFLLDILLKLYKFNCIVFSNHNINFIKLNDLYPYIILFYYDQENQYYLTSFNKNFIITSLPYNLNILNDDSLFIEYHLKNFIDLYYSPTLQNYHTFMDIVILYIDNQIIPSLISISKSNLLSIFIQSFYENYPSISFDTVKNNINSFNRPLNDEPLTDKPLTDKPLNYEPLTDEPLTDEPLNDEHLTDKII